MIVELNDGQIKFECDMFTYLLSNKGIPLEFRFEEYNIPGIIYSCFKNAHFNRIKNAKVYTKNISEWKKYLPTYEDIYIESIVEGSPLNIVKMRASKINFRIESLKPRFCSNEQCGCIISELTVMQQLIPWVGVEMAENIWNSETVIFYCCACYHYMRNHLLIVNSVY